MLVQGKDCMMYRDGDVDLYLSVFISFDFSFFAVIFFFTILCFCCFFIFVSTKLFYLSFQALRTNYIWTCIQQRVLFSVSLDIDA